MVTSEWVFHDKLSLLVADEWIRFFSLFLWIAVTCPVLVLRLIHCLLPYCMQCVPTCSRGLMSNGYAQGHLPVLRISRGMLRRRPQDGPAFAPIAHSCGRECVGMASSGSFVYCGRIHVPCRWVIQQTVNRAHSVNTILHVQRMVCQFHHQPCFFSAINCIVLLYIGGICLYRIGGSTNWLM